MARAARSLFALRRFGKSRARLHPLRQGASARFAVIQSQRHQVRSRVVGRGDGAEQSGTRDRRSFDLERVANCSASHRGVVHMPAAQVEPSAKRLTLGRGGVSGFLVLCAQAIAAWT